MPDADKVYQAEISFYSKKFICTNGGKPIIVRGDNGFRKEYPTADTKVVSTIGAGDNFNAGLVYGMIKNNVTKQQIADGMPEALWDKLIASAQQFAGECCKSIYNYIEGVRS